MKMPWQAPAYLSWYQQPRLHRPIEYLFKNVEGDWEYTTDKASAFKFDTRTEALAVTPTYDGSAGITERAGVMMVAK